MQRAGHRAGQQPASGSATATSTPPRAAAPPRPLRPMAPRSSLPAMAPRQEAERATTEVTEIAPGILRLQLPIAMPGLGHVNCYALEDERGVTVVDPGMPGPKSWKALVDRFGRGGFALRNVHTVVVTHSHVDHFGASGRLRVEAGAQVVTADSFRRGWAPPDGGGQELGAVEGTEAPPDSLPWAQPPPGGGAPPRPPL